MTTFYVNSGIPTPTAPQLKPSGQVHSALSHEVPSLGQISPDAIQEAIDRAYHGLMRVSTDAERRHWLDRLKFWIARVKG